MYLDTTKFPLVYLKDNEHESPEGQILALLDRSECFVLITEHLPSPDHDQGESHEERKQRTLFFKRQKQHIRDLCVGGIVITGENTIPAYVRIPAQIVGRAAPAPVNRPQHWHSDAFKHRRATHHPASALPHARE